MTESGLESSAPMPTNAEIATFGAGCFWCVEDTFRKLPGVISTTCGYMGGQGDHPTYKQVCSGNTGHAEVVQVVFDPTRLGYEQLLEVFWQSHDPTQLNRQGPDVGEQYRSVIFVHSPQQQQLAQASQQALEHSGRLHRPIATIIESAPTFWPAEDYHQQYYEKQCRI